MLVKHTKTNNIADWTQNQLNTIISGGAAPLPPAGTVLNDVTLPSDWNHAHTVTGTASSLAGYDGSGASQDVTVGSGLQLSAGTLSSTSSGGSVTTVSVVSANGLAGTVANATSTPAITLSTSVNAPALAGNGTAISAATTTGSGSTVVLATAPSLSSVTLTGATSLTTTGNTVQQGNLAASGATTVTLSSAQAYTLGPNGATNPTFNVRTNVASAATGLQVTGQAAGGGANLEVLSSGTNENLVLVPKGSGTVTTSANISAGNLSGTNTGDQTITLTGAVTGSGTGSFATTIQSSIALPGSPTTTTQAAGDNSTKIATDAFVTTAINNAIAGVNPAVAVQWATTQASDTSGLTYANGVSGIGATLTGANNATTSMDGHTFVIGDVGVTRVLVKNDTQSPSGAFNGVYLFTALHTVGTGDVFTRALDYDTSSDINNTGAIPVVNGTANTNTSWLLTSTVNTVGTDPLTYVQFSLAPSTIATLTGTQTLTNKRITKRVSALSAGSATPAINTDTTDVVHITAQSAAITSFTTNLTGTPVNGDSLRIDITDDGTGRALTFGSSFEASTVALPTTTVASTRLDIGFFWNSVTSKWRCVAVA